METPPPIPQEPEPGSVLLDLAHHWIFPIVTEIPKPKSDGERDTFLEGL